MADEGKLKYEVVLDIEDMKRKIGEAEGKFEHMSRSASKAGSNLRAAWTAMGGPILTVAGAAAVLAKTMGAAIKTNMEFERKSSELAAVLGTTKDRVKVLTDAAKELGRTTEFSATQVEELQIALARLGFSNNQILSMQGSVLKFAAAVNTDLGSAADFAGSALRAFGLEATDTNRLLDIMAASTSKSALDFSKLQTSISIVAPIAHSFGLSVEDTVTFLGALSNAGFDASSAATAFRNILLNLADANGNLAKGLGHTAKTFPEIIAALKECTEKGLDLGSAMEMTDKRSVSAFSALISGADSAKKLRDELGNCEGAMDQMYETMTDNLEGAVKGLSSAWEGLMLTMSKSNGVLKSAVDLLTGAVNATTDLVSGGGKTWTKEDYLAEFQARIDRDGKEVAMKAYEEWVKKANAEYEEARSKPRPMFDWGQQYKKNIGESWNRVWNLGLIRQELEAYETPEPPTPGGNSSNVKVLTDAEKKEIENAKKALTAATKDMWMKVNDAKIAAMQDGTAKKLAAIENDRLQALDAINKEQEEIEKLSLKSGVAVKQDTYDQLQKRRDDVNATALRQRREAEEEQARFLAGIYQELGDVFLSQEQRKIEGIKRTYEEQRRQLKTALDGGTISQADYDKLVAQSQKAEAKETGDAWVESFGTFDQKLDALRKKAAETLKGVPAEFAEEAARQMESIIADFIAGNSKSQNAVTRLFGDMSRKSVKDLRAIVAEGKTLQEFLGSGTWDATLGEKMGITQEQFNTLRQSPEQLEKIAKVIREIEGQADDMDNLFRQIGQGLKDIVKSGGDFAQMRDGLKQLTTGMQKASQLAGYLSDSLSRIADASDNQGLKDAVNGMNAAFDAIQATTSGMMAGSMFGPIGAAVGGAIGLATSIFTSVNQAIDDGFSRKIEATQKSIDSLSVSYDDLSETVDKVFGAQRRQGLEAMNSNLERQNELIRQQMADEEAKKNTDTNAIQSYEDRLRENERQIRANKEAALDALFGADIKSAITGFTDAITSAWQSGEKGAKNAKEYVRTMMQGMVSEAIKAYVQASGQMDRIRDYMTQAMADQVVTDEERKHIEDMAKELADDVQSQYGWAENMFSDKERSGMRGSGIAASQESVDETNARMTTIQEHTYTLVQGQKELIGTSSRILEKVTEIADNTEQTNAGIRGINESLAKVRVAVDTMATRGVKIQ